MIMYSSQFEHGRLNKSNFAAEKVLHFPLSALRSLQESPADEGISCHSRRSIVPEDERHKKKKHHKSRSPVEPLDLLPSRRSSLAAVERRGRARLHLPLPPRPLSEEGRFSQSSPASSPLISLNVGLSPPRSASENCFEVPGQMSSMHAAPGLPYMTTYCQSHSSAQSFYSTSGSSSASSLPLPTPPEAYHFQPQTPFNNTISEKELDRHARANQFLYPVPEPVPHLQYPLYTDYQTRSSFDAHGRGPALQNNSDSTAMRGNESPFAYTVDSAAPSVRSSVSFGDWRSGENSHTGQRSRGRSHTSSVHCHLSSVVLAHGSSNHVHHHPYNRRSAPSCKYRSARSVNDYLIQGPHGSSYMSRLGDHRPSLPTTTTELLPFIERSSFHGINERSLAPFRCFPASVVHRAGINSLVSVSDVSEASMHAPAAPMPRLFVPCSSPIHERDSQAAESTSAAPVFRLDLMHPTKRPCGWTNTDPPQHWRPPALLIAAAVASECRSRSVGRARSQKTTHSTTQVKLNHAEVMVRLNRKMKERIAAKQHSMAPNSSTRYKLNSERHRHHSDSVSSSVSSTPAASTILLYSPALTEGHKTHPASPVQFARSGSNSTTSMHEDPAHCSPPRSSPFVGIESLLSAAAINDVEAR